MKKWICGILTKNNNNFNINLNVLVPLVMLLIGLMGPNWVHFAHYAMVYRYFEFKLHFLKNLKLLSIYRLKELFEPIVFAKKKATGFCSV